MSAYGIENRVALDYDAAVEKVTETLKEEGFGVLTSIDVKATLKAKIDKDFKRYVILGACNPNLAYQGLTTEPDIGLLLPCNVVVQEDGDGSLVTAIDPETMLGVVGNESLKEMATQVKEKITRAINNVG